MFWFREDDAASSISIFSNYGKKRLLIKLTNVRKISAIGLKDVDALMRCLCKDIHHKNVMGPCFHSYMSTDLTYGVTRSGSSEESTL